MGKVNESVVLANVSADPGTPEVFCYRADLSQGDTGFGQQTFQPNSTSPLTVDFNGNDFPNGTYSLKVGAYSADNVVIGSPITKTVVVADPVIRQVPQSFQ